MSKDHGAIVNIIKRGVWFQGLPPEAIDKLAARATTRSFDPHQFLYMLGEVPDHIFCIVEGSVRISLSSSNGQQFMLALLYQDYWFGESAIAGNESRVLEVWAETDAEILLIPGTTVKAVASDFPVIYKNLFLEHVNRTRLVYEVLAGMLFYPLKARLAGRLLFLLKHHGVPHKDGIALNLKVNQMDFAHMSMGSRQRVNKAFREWVRAGVIDKQRNNYIVKDVEALKQATELEGS